MFIPANGSTLHSFLNLKCTFMSTVQWKGVYPALLTPFTTADTIDFDMFRINTNAQLRAGVDGLVLGGSLGEASTLTLSEKAELLTYAKELAAGQVPVIMNIAESATKSAVQAAQEAEKGGADGLMLL